MKKTKLAKAVVIAATGATLSLGMVSTASAHVMYNTWNAFGTDGWTLSGGRANTGEPNPWMGTVKGDRPYDYVGKQALNWAATIHTAGSSLEVSQADAIKEYGFAADIDTANGAWGSWPEDPANPSINVRGWGHNTDFGLIKSHIDTDIRIDVSKVNAGDDISNFGITVFTGMDDGTDVFNDDGELISFNHHSVWNKGYISGINEAPAQKDNPFITNGVNYLTHGDQSSVVFHALADQVYSVYLGGNDVNGDIFGTPTAYKATISAVPVPAAVWLFGTGLVGLVSFGRRKQKAV